MNVELPIHAVAAARAVHLLKAGLVQAYPVPEDAASVAGEEAEEVEEVEARAAQG